MPPKQNEHEGLQPTTRNRSPPTGHQESYIGAIAVASKLSTNAIPSNQHAVNALMAPTITVWFSFSPPSALANCPLPSRYARAPRVANLTAASWLATPSGPYSATRRWWSAAWSAASSRCAGGRGSSEGRCDAHAAGACRRRGLGERGRAEGGRGAAGRKAKGEGISLESGYRVGVNSTDSKFEYWEEKRGMGTLIGPPATQQRLCKT